MLFIQNCPPVMIFFRFIESARSTLSTIVLPHLGNWVSWRPSSTVIAFSVVFLLWVVTGQLNALLYKERYCSLGVSLLSVLHSKSRHYRIRSLIHLLSSTNDNCDACRFEGLVFAVCGPLLNWIKRSCISIALRIPRISVTASYGPYDTGVSFSFQLILRARPATQQLAVVSLASAGQDTPTPTHQERGNSIATTLNGFVSCDSSPTRKSTKRTIFSTRRGRKTLSSPQVGAPVILEASIEGSSNQSFATANEASTAKQSNTCPNLDGTSPASSNSSSLDSFVTGQQCIGTTSGTLRASNQPTTAVALKGLNYFRVDGAWVTARLGRYYDLGTVLGQGGFGKVLKVFEKGLQCATAVKIIDIKKRVDAPPGSTPIQGSTKDDNRLVRSAEVEIEMLSSLKHQHIVQYHWAAHVPSMHSIFISMELMSTCLHKTIKQMNVLEKRHALREIALALRYIHSVGIIHRDLKCANIGLVALPSGSSWKYTAKLIDFGIAASFRPVAPRDWCGTPGYMPPETVRRQTQSNKSDVWSFGCLAFELMFGERPFRGKKVETFKDLMIFSPASPMVTSSMLENAFGSGNEAAESIAEFHEFWDGCMKVDQCERKTVDELLRMGFLCAKKVL